VLRFHANVTYALFTRNASLLVTTNLSQTGRIDSDLFSTLYSKFGGKFQRSVTVFWHSDLCDRIYIYIYIYLN